MRQPHVRIENWKVKLDNDTKKYRLIKGCDLQLYEGVAFSPNSKITDRGRLFWILNNLLYLYKMDVWKKHDLVNIVIAW